MESNKAVGLPEAGAPVDAREFKRLCDVFAGATERWNGAAANLKKAQREESEALQQREDARKAMDIAYGVFTGAERHGVKSL